MITEEDLDAAFHQAEFDFSKYEKTDAGNALAFLDWSGLHFDGDAYFVMDKRRRKIDFNFNDALLPHIRRMTDEMLAWARALPIVDLTQASFDRQDAWITHALKSQSLARLRAVERLALAEAMERYVISRSSPGTGA